MCIGSRIFARQSRQDQHRIAVGIEAIAGSNCFLVRFHDEVIAGKRSDEHQESRSGQMEIRYEMIDCAKLVWGANEDSRLTRAFHEPPV